MIFQIIFVIKKFYYKNPFWKYFYTYLGYIQGAAALCVITILMDIAATVMTGMGLCSKDPTRKYALYRFALYVMVGACKYNLQFLKVYNNIGQHFFFISTTSPKSSVSR